LIWRSEIYDVDLGISLGQEASEVRPGVILSADLINHGPWGLAGVVPITSTRYDLRTHVELEVGHSGLNQGLLSI
jgi:mRNA-degrading endonuclease toxin of MazEF toxin-antitoxin module